MRITELTQAAGGLWDCYVYRVQSGLPHHLSGWRTVMASTYGYETIYLMATQASGTGGGAINGAHSTTGGEGDAIVGVLPLFVIRSPLLGNTVTSMPGGLCADNDGVALALLDCAKEKARSLGANRLVLHDSRQMWPDDQMITSSGHEHWLVDVREGVDAVWQDLDRNVRRQIRIARRNGLEATVDRSGDQVDEFYDLFSRFAHSAGTPIFPRAFVHNIVSTFPSGFSNVRVCLDGKTIGAYFQLELGSVNYGVWGATLREFLDLRPVYLAYWTILEDTIAQGFDFLDMGRSPANSNASKYKGQWGGVPSPIYQQAYGLRDRAKAKSVADRTQTDTTFQLVRTLWPKLPYRVAQFLGPQVRRHVPFA